ncbi:PP2C family protein-serine/threonine phosphatase [Sanguibacter suaedae]|uniref:Serine/threonine protein phosphatase PstP n=1 Tax=Sanguibacter suaedae TaxID=2795737 RepID=A0A934I272_9MICO|nr:PP2C family serine/threonine-protein phosphatase [Sanguibacter suaedae]MBI9113838.1 serine/threonine-protein phosphatase [Sanguibacter suaedae]
MTIALRYAARSDVGLVRSNNQDSGYAGPHLLLVADGMGGHAGGDIASSLAVASLAPLDGEAFGSNEILERLEKAIETARVELVRRARADSELGGMGTTVTALLRSGNKLAMAHMGDSRAYVLRDGVLSQVTKDHTFVQHLVDTGKITPDEAEHHPQRSVVMRVLGDFDLDLSPDLSVREARAGDRWLLCSDGLSGFVSVETLQRTLADVPDVDACAERLVQLALRAGGSDNITCIVADVLDLDDVPDGDGPDPGVQVVGAVAVTRDDPTTAADGPAARAAVLLAEARAKVDALSDADGHPIPSDGTTTETDDLPFTEVVRPTPAEPRSRAQRRADKRAAAREEKAAAALRKADAKAARREAAETDEPRYRWVWTVLGLLLTAAFLATAGWFGYRWTQTQYYVGVEDGRVAIFQGIAQTAGPLHLSSVVEVSDLETSELDAFVANQLDRTIRATSLEDARERVQVLVSDAAGDA